MEDNIIEISYKDAINFLLPRHYSGRKPIIQKAFGLIEDNILQAVITYGKPASPSVCNGICGKEYANNVYELNRLCRRDEFNKQLSYFVGKTLRMLKQNNWIIVSYSDTAMSHNGYIYQACNFIYTGLSSPHVDKYDINNMHNRHANASYVREDEYCVERSRKHRYIYFCTKNKSLKKIWREKLCYEILPYPKGVNKNYKLGEFIGKTIINNKTGEKIELKNNLVINKINEQTFLF
jgi:hypothetical protein